MNKKTNTEILKLLKQYFDKFPDQRFCQGLVNLGIIKCHNGMAEDPFYIINEEVLHDIKNNSKS